jgi:hypothetical protein
MITGIFSLALSINKTAEIVDVLVSARECDELSQDCPSVKTSLLLAINIVQILYWVCGLMIIVRFFVKFRAQYSHWKASFSYSKGPDSNFQHWAFKNSFCTQEKCIRSAMDNL